MYSRWPPDNESSENNDVATKESNIKHTRRMKHASRMNLKRAMTKPANPIFDHSCVSTHTPCEEEPRDSKLLHRSTTSVYDTRRWCLLNKAQHGALSIEPVDEQVPCKYVVPDAPCVDRLFACKMSARSQKWLPHLVVKSVIFQLQLELSLVGDHPSCPRGRLFCNKRLSNTKPRQSASQPVEMPLETTRQ